MITFSDKNWSQRVYDAGSNFWEHDSMNQMNQQMPVFCDHLLRLFFVEVDAILVGYHARDDTHCLPVNFHVNTRLRDYRQQKESSQAQNLERTQRRSMMRHLRVCPRWRWAWHLASLFDDQVYEIGCGRWAEGHRSGTTRKIPVERDVVFKSIGYFELVWKIIFTI